MSAQPSPEDYRPDQARDDGSHDRELTIMEHLDELRHRLFWCAVSIAVGTVVGLIFGRQIIKFLQRPAQHAYPGFRTVQLGPTDFLGSYFKVAILVGLILAMPMLVYQTLAYVIPALTRTERRWVIPILAGTFLFFSCGVVFAYYIVVPKALDFLLNFGNGISVPTYRVTTYIDFVVRIVFWTGVLFELPIVMMAPAKFGIVTARRYLKWWRYAIVLGFLAAAAVIPNISPIEQTSVAAPIIGLYFLGVFFAWLVQPKQAKT